MDTIIFVIAAVVRWNIVLGMILRSARFDEHDYKESPKLIARSSIMKAEKLQKVTYGTPQSIALQRFRFFCRLERLKTGRKLTVLRPVAYGLDRCRPLPPYGWKADAFWCDHRLLAWARQCFWPFRDVPDDERDHTCVERSLLENKFNFGPV